MADGINKGGRRRANCGMAMKLLVIMALSAILFGGVPAGAAPDAGSPAEPPPESSGVFLKTLDRSHETLSREIDLFSERIGLFLGGDRICEISEDSYIQAGVSTVLLRGGAIRFDRILRAKIDLPNTQRRFRLLLESDPERNFREILSPGERSSTETENLTPQGPGTNFSAALQYVMQERRKWLMSLDAGIEVEFPPDPFARARLKRSFTAGDWRFTFGETLFWFVSLGPGASTHFDVEQYLSFCELLFRASTEIVWRERAGGFDLSQAISLFQELTWRSVLTYKFGITGEAKENTQLNAWGLGVEYRRRVYKNWLYLSVEPAVAFSKADNFQADPSIRFTVDISFGAKYLQQ